MSLPKIFMFSGQGSQYYQMGRSLYDQAGVFADSMNRMDHLLGRLTGRSVVEALYGGTKKSELFDDILSTHPAIYMVEVALAEHLASLGVVAHMTLGTSLGTYAAATVSGCLAMEDALALVVHSAQCAVSHCAQGGMLAVLGDVAAASTPPLSTCTTVAGRSFPGHYVLSGTEADLQAAESLLQARNTITQRLPVRYAFHSHAIDPAREPFLQKSRALTYAAARLPLVCCAEKRMLTQLPADYFWKVARAPIEFQETIDHVESAGAFHYVDIGPSATLSTFIKYALPPTSKSRSSAVMTPYGHDLRNLAALLQDPA